MLFYCLKCRKNIESKNRRVVYTKKGKPMLLSNCTVYRSKKSRFQSKNKKLSIGI